MAIPDTGFTGSDCRCEEYKQSGSTSWLCPAHGHCFSGPLIIERDVLQEKIDAAIEALTTGDTVSRAYRALEILKR